jgi:PAS domain S-box-containing protein
MRRFSLTSIAGWTGRVLFLGAAYYVTGRLGLLLAIPPGFATAVWPPSGIAFAGLLHFGARTWPGVWLGSLLVNIATGYSAADPWTSLFLVTTIATGSTLQALAGAAFIRRFIGYPNPLLRAQDIAAFMLLGGPAACLIAASIGVSALWYAGRVATPDFSFNWFNWWVGDSIGVLTVAGLLLVWTTASDGRARYRRWLITGPVVVASALVVTLFFYSSRREQARVAREFEEGGARAAAALSSRLQYSMEALLALRTLYTYAHVLGRAEFIDASEEFLSRRPEVQALSWNPRLAASTQAGRVGYPVAWIVPHEGNERAIGFDVMTDPTRRATLERACTSGQMAASPLVALVQNEHWLGSLVFLPVPLTPAAPTRASAAGTCHDRLRGVLVAVYRPDRLLRTAIGEASPAEFRYRILDGGGTTPASVLHDSAGAGAWTAGSGGLPPYTAPLRLGDRDWRLEVIPTAHFLTTRRSLQAWTVLAGGLLFTSALTGILLIVTGRTVLVEGVVQERTDALREANLALVQSQSRLMSFVEHAPAAVAMFDRDLRYVAVSQRWIEDYRLGDRDLIGLHHYDVFPEIRNLPAWQAIHQRALAGAIERSEEDHFVRADGRDEWLAWEVRPWFDSKGEVAGIIMLTEVITARKLAALALQESQERLRLALDNARQGLWDWNIETGEALLDATWWSILGHEPVERTARADVWERSIHPDDHERVMQRLRRSLSTDGELFDVEYRSRRVDGSWIWVNTRGRVQARSADGRAMRMMGTLQDVSVRKRAEANFEALLEAAPDGIVIVGADGRIVLVNEQTQRLFGYEREELIGSGIDLLVPDRHRDRHGRHRDSYFGDPRARSMGEALQLFGRRKDGSEFPVEISLSPLQTETGLLVSGAIRDVTNRRREQVALQRSEERLRLAIDNASLGLWEWDIPSRTVMADANWRQIMGFGPDEPIDVRTAWRSAIHADDWPRVSEMLERHLVTPDERYDVDYRVTRKSGELIWLNSRGRVDKRDADGRPLHMIGTIQDVSERKHAEELIRTSLEEKEVLLREIHHRVKNNLAVVSSLFYLQSINTDRPDVVRLFEESRNRIRSMALVHEQLYRSHLLAAVDFVEYSTSLATQLLRTYERADTRVRLVTKMAPLHLSVDLAIPCGLVLNELLTNCLKHAFVGRREGSIEIELVATDDGHHVLRVSDDGVGMTNVDLAATQSLGMRLVRSLAKQLDGTVTFEPRARGASVSLRFAA